MGWECVSSALRPSAGVNSFVQLLCFIGCIPGVVDLVGEKLKNKSIGKSGMGNTGDLLSRGRLVKAVKFLELSPPDI